MNTVVSEWQIVTIIDEKGQSIGDVLFLYVLKTLAIAFNRVIISVLHVSPTSIPIHVYSKQ